MKFQTAGRSEPQKPACAPTPAPSIRPAWHGTMMSGTSSKWSASHVADARRRTACACTLGSS